MTNTQAVIFIAVLFVIVAFFEEIEAGIKRRWKARQDRKAIEHHEAYMAPAKRLHEGNLMVGEHRRLPVKIDEPLVLAAGESLMDQRLQPWMYKRPRPWTRLRFWLGRKVAR